MTEWDTLDYPKGYPPCPDCDARKGKPCKWGGEYATRDVAAPHAARLRATLGSESVAAIPKEKTDEVAKRRGAQPRLE